MNSHFYRGEIMNLREFLDVLVGLNTTRELDLTVGNVPVKGTIKTTRVIQKK